MIDYPVFILVSSLVFALAFFIWNKENVLNNFVRFVLLFLVIWGFFCYSHLMGWIVKK